METGKSLDGIVNNGDVLSHLKPDDGTFAYSKRAKLEWAALYGLCLDASFVFSTYWGSAGLIGEVGMDLFMLACVLYYYQKGKHDTSVFR